MWMIAILEKIDWKGLPEDKWILKSIDLFPTRLGNEDLQLLLKQGENMTKFLKEAFRYYIEGEEELKNAFFEKKYRIVMDDINLFTYLMKKEK